MSDKLSESMLKKLLGKRTPLPGGDKTLSPQMRPKAAEMPASAPRSVAGQLTRSPLDVTSRPTEARMEKAEKGMKAGGKVRGMGCASKGFGKGKMC